MIKKPTKKFLNEAMNYLFPIIKQAGKMSLDSWEKIEVVKYKDKRDIVTKADIEIENFLKKKIISKWPNHGFWGEETERINSSSPFQWLIDPIDGTKYYAKSTPFFYVHIALLFEGEPILGLIYNPISKQLFSASKGNRAFLNNKLISLKSPVLLNEAIVDLDFLGLIDKSLREKKWIINKVGKIMKKIYRARITGGTLNIYLVTGAINAYVNFGYSKPQDLAARLIIMQEAGYKIKWIKTPFQKKILIVSREPILSELKKIINENH
jgi:fructose-1,6-bisphosphatase/inositol monophosphatase family enzyme